MVSPTPLVPVLGNEVALDIALVAIHLGQAPSAQITPFLFQSTGA